ncbi:MAG TPA: serpin family protein [bacterium]|jgi:serpin B|nr:serpin family protein [bacterium]HNZ53134.1 serpin family protein [bacterium]HOG44022.1 serpin family protein [bacterium]HPY13780.1 serpin family protein [bacterium]HQB08352.1 serpin family protein [bacterium]
MKIAVIFIFLISFFFLSCNENQKHDEVIDEFSGFGDDFPVLDSETSDNEPEYYDSDAEIFLKYNESDKKAYSVNNSIISANIEFAVKMLKTILADEEEKNIFFSPISISVALSMTMNGADGENHEEMSKALEFSGMTQKEINEGFLDLIESLNYCDNYAELNLANSIWIAPNYSDCISEPFIETLEKYYLSGVFEADSPDSINDWIKEKTNGKIEKVIDAFPDKLVMYLINAIYFQGAWTIPFEKENTQPADFFKKDGSIVSTDMMKIEKRGEYILFADDHLSGIRLPYGREKIAFYAFISNGDRSIDEYLNKLTAPYLSHVLNSFNKSIINGIFIPKFRIDYERSLMEIFASFGMKKAFYGGFENMKNDKCSGFDPYISAIKHKSFIDVAEEGTEAAAVTVVETSDEFSSEFFFNLDRPFFFLIRDDRNGTILFMGKVADPTQK